MTDTRFPDDQRPDARAGQEAPSATSTDQDKKRGSIFSLRRPVEVPPQEKLEPLISYWSGLRRGPNVPRRADVDPRQITPLLPNTFLLERIAPGLARFRLAGTEVANLMGMDVRGMPLSAILSPAARDTICEPLERMFAEPGMLELTLTAQGGPAKPELAARMVVLPLACENGEVARAIGALVSNGKGPGRAPRRFQIRSIAVTEVRKIPHTSRPAPSLAPIMERSPASAPTTPASARAPHLRLVHSV